jgi:hypothetical protein
MITCKNCVCFAICKAKIEPYENIETTVYNLHQLYIKCGLISTTRSFSSAYVVLYEVFVRKLETTEREN